MKCLLGCKTEVGLTQAPVKLQEGEIIKVNPQTTNHCSNLTHSLAKVWKNGISYLNLLTWDGGLWVWLLFIFDGQVPQGMVGKGVQERWAADAKTNASHTDSERIWWNEPLSEHELFPVQDLVFYLHVFVTLQFYNEKPNLSFWPVPTEALPGRPCPMLSNTVKERRYGVSDWNEDYESYILFVILKLCQCISAAEELLFN